MLLCTTCESDDVRSIEVGSGPTGVSAPDGGQEFSGSYEAWSCLKCGAIDTDITEIPNPPEIELPEPRDADVPPAAFQQERAA